MRPFPRSSGFSDFSSLKWFCAGALIFVLPFASRSASPGTGDYLIDVWTADNGLRSSSVTAIAQTLDGYLWIGTYNGLARFDGVRFVMFDPANTPALQRARVRRLNVDARGTLWINTYDGSLTSFRDGQFQLEWKGDGSSDATTTMISSRSNSIAFLLHTGELLRRRPAEDQWQRLRPPGLSSGTLCVEDREGTIWGRGRDQRLWRFSGERFELMPTNSSLEGSALHSLTTDPKGNIWVGTEREIAMWTGSCFQTMTPTNGESTLNVSLLHIAPDGDVWIIANERVRKARERQWVFEAEPCRGLFSGYQDRLGLQEDRNGGVWLYHYGKGLFHIRSDGHTRQLALEENFPGERVDCFFEDREGNLWSGVDRGGLVRLRQKRFVSLNPDDSLSRLADGNEDAARSPSGATAKAAVSVAEDSEGGIWIGTYGGGLHRLHDGNWQSFSVPGGTRRGFVFSVCPDAERRLWVSAGDEDLFVKTEEQFRPAAPAVHGVKALLASRDGRVWIGNKSGLWSWSQGQLRQFRAEVRRTDIRALAEGTNGIIWAGAGDGFLYRIATNHVDAFQTGDSLSAQPIWSLCADDDGSVWVGTFRAGLLHFRNGHFDRFTTKDGLPDDVICQILDDSNGRLWIGSQQGIFWVSKSDVDDFIHGKTKSINCTAYGRYDGLPSLECSGSYQPAACRTHDGHLLFCTLKGVVSVNPQELAPNRLPPPVVIEEVLVDGQVQQNQSAVRASHVELPPGKRQLEFRYAGLSFVSPDRVRFRYQLVGLDKNMREAGTRRSAQYSFLPPGDYTFRVTACNNDGVWNEETAAVSLKVLPHFYEAWWFWPGIALTALVAVAVAVRQIVVRRLHRQLEELERQRAVERDRARIAKDIHDDLGAGLTQITLLSELARRDPSAQAEGHLERISDSARKMTRRIDEIVWAVDPQHDTLNGLMDYISAFTEDFLRTAGIRCRMDMPATLPALHLPAELRYNLFLALKEALNNVVKHARATEVRLGLRFENNGFTLVVEDDGQGMASTPATENGDRLVPGHGLPNLEKRLAAIGGSCIVHSVPNQGTRIEMTVQVAGSDTMHWGRGNGSPSPIVATPHNGSPEAQSHR
jgi:signal transduction histidine kinase/ligand-binding sensor domain-containing protein